MRRAAPRPSLRSPRAPIAVSGVPARSAVALRAGLSATVAVLVSAIAHAAAGGTVNLAAAGWALAALVVPAAWLARRERGWLGLAAAQLAGQQAAHMALTASHDAYGAALLPTDLMLYGHLLAAAVTAFWLRVGERRAFAAIRGILDAGRLLIAGPPRPPLTSNTTCSSTPCSTPTPDAAPWPSDDAAVEVITPH
jgi:hypothetical protein